jgi:hypothetical protein
MPVQAKERQNQRNGSNAMEPDAMAVAAMKRGNTEMKIFFFEMCDMNKTTSD